MVPGGFSVLFDYCFCVFIGRVWGGSGYLVLAIGF